MYIQKKAKKKKIIIKKEEKKIQTNNCPHERGNIILFMKLKANIMCIT